MSADIKDQLLDFICDQFKIGKDEINTEESLVDQGVIDSFGFVEISEFLERSLSIRVTEDMITPENFGSIEKIVVFAASSPVVNR